jgi:nuclear GTP-binding protein
MKLKKPGAKNRKQPTLAIKYKRKAKGREAERKLRKEAKKAKANGTYQKKMKKDPGIPNLWPFKHELLESIKRKKNAMDTSRLENKVAGQPAVNTDVIVPDYHTMLRENAKRARTFDSIQEAGEGAAARGVADNTRKAFFRDLRKVIETSDVLIQVLDARDPNACRCKELEKEITDRGKRVVLVMNKIDLVPQEATVAWLAHLRKDFPTVAFKAAQTSKSGGAKKPVHASTNAEDASAGVLGSAFTVVGAERLLQLLKNYSRVSADKKRQITVGVVGYPNVGKSSVINSLKRSAAVKVGATAGVTRHTQEVQLDSKLTLIDSPGVVFAGNQNDPSVILRNAANVETLDDPIGVVDALLARAPKGAVLRHFCVADFDSVAAFLVQIAKARGKFKKGGAANLEAAARVVLTDWTSGKLRYYCMPPKARGVEDENAALAQEAQVVTSYGQELDIEALFRGEDKEWEGLHTDGKAIAMTSGAFGTIGAEDDEDEAEEMDEDEEGDDDDEDEEDDDDMEEDDDEEDEDDDENESKVMIDEAPKKRKGGGDDYDFGSDWHLPS